MLFLDEPTIGLDVVAQKTMRDFIKEYNERFNATIVLTSHYMGDVKELCKRVIIINEGKILYDGLLTEIVEKFAPYKIIKADFEKMVDKDKLIGFGEIKNYDGLYVEIQLSKEEVAKKAAKLLSSFAVADLTIEDPAIEDIIRQVFKKGTV